MTKRKITQKELKVSLKVALLGLGTFITLLPLREILLANLDPLAQIFVGALIVLGVLWFTD